MKLKLFTINQINRYFTSLHIMNNLVPSKDLAIFFSGSDIHDHITRSGNQLRFPKHRRTQTKQSLIINGPKQWNNLPLELRKCRNVQIFKKKLKSCILKIF